MMYEVYVVFLEEGEPREIPQTILVNLGINNEEEKDITLVFRDNLLKQFSGGVRMHGYGQLGPYFANEMSLEFKKKSSKLQLAIFQIDIATGTRRESYQRNQVHDAIMKFFDKDFFVLAAER